MIYDSGSYICDVRLWVVYRRYTTLGRSLEEHLLFLCDTASIDDHKTSMTRYSAPLQFFGGNKGLESLDRIDALNPQSSTLNSELSSPNPQPSI